LLFISANFRNLAKKKNPDVFGKKMAPSRHITRKEKTKVAIFIVQLPTSRQIIGEVFSIL
jgi:hypothetical protein